jgi:hypothetical protein
MDKKFAQSDENMKRRMEDFDSSQELLKSINMDLSKITEYNETDTKKAQETLEYVKSKSKIPPKEILS